MTHEPKRHAIPDPYPETLGFSAMTIFVPEGFRGDAEVIWWYPGKSADADRQRITCNANALLQGVFRDVRGERPSTLFDARVVALVLHTFYRLRIEAVARLEAAYEWRSYLPEDQTPAKPASSASAIGIVDAKHGLGAVMTVAWEALAPEDFERATIAARTLRQLLVKMESKGDQT